MSVTMADAQLIDAGRRQILSEKRTLCFQFHGFADMEHKRGEFEVSPPSLRCHGYRWAVKLYPHGSDESPKDDVSISVYFVRVLDEGEQNRQVEVNFSLQTGGSKRTASRVLFGGEDDDNEDEDDEEEDEDEDDNNVWGWDDFATRADVLDDPQNPLVDGTLTVTVDLQVYLEKPSVWTPARTMTHQMLEMFKNGEFSDVEFVVGDKHFRAHKVFLAMSAPSLVQLAENVAENTAIQIENVDPTIFEKMIHFIYSEELPSDFNTDAKALLEVADKFGCTKLKIFAEAELATSGISIENAAEMFLLADRMNCALLKEATTQLFVANSKKVMETQGFAQIKESPKLLLELMEHLSDPPTFSNGDETNVDRMGVSALRRKLDEAGLDVDGTREMLVKRLKTTSK